MENAGAVTFLEDYVFRSKVTDATLRAPRRDDPARAGAHVVRRPRHHALVGRPVAQRVVRHLHQRAVPVRGHPVDTTAWTTFANAEKAWAYRAGPAPLHPPDRRRHPRHRRRRGQLRRHHLRQGRLGAQAAGRLRRPGRVPRRRAPLLHAARVRQHRRWPTCSPRWRRAPAATCPSGRAVAGDQPGQHPAPGVRARPTTAATRASPSSRPPSPSTRRCAPTGWRSACTATGPTALDPHARGSSSTSSAPAPRCPSWSAQPRRRPGAGQRRRPHLRQDPARRAVAGARCARGIGALRRPAGRARCAGRRPGT